MDMKIAGSGIIGAGEYDNVGISGSGRIQGAIKCNKLTVSGAASSEDVKTNIAKIAGSFKCNGNLFAEGEVKISGSAKFCKKLKCVSLNIAGAVRVNEDIEAENIHICGKIDCPGLVNAEKIDIEVENATSNIGSIGGSILTVRKNAMRNLSFIIFKWFSKSYGTLAITNEIECDTVDIESVTAPKVVGRIVKIGDDCDIELVQYSENIEISPKAKVGKTEKI